MAKTTLADFWLRYLASLSRSQSFTPAQERAFRNMFYGGAIAAFEIMDKAMSGPLDDTQRIREALRAEVKQFVDEEEKRNEEQEKRNNEPNNH